MSPKTRSTQRGDVSLIDMLAIIAAVAIVGVVGLTYFQRSQHHLGTSRIRCVNNLRQVGLSFSLWALDNSDKMPGMVSTNQGGAMELVAAGSPVSIFNVMSNELCTPKLLNCPADSARMCATNFATLTLSNMSYFAVPEADETMPLVWLSGDRNLATNGTMLKTGLGSMAAKRIWSWSPGLHVQSSRPGGNLAFGDGSVQQLTDRALHLSATNALASFMASNSAPFRLLIP